MQNMGALLQQAQMMQKKMQEVENKLRTMEVEGQGESRNGKSNNEW